MKLDLRGIRVNRCEYRNEIPQNYKVNLKVSVNNQIRLPKQLDEHTVGMIQTKVMVGSPMEPLYLYVELMTSYADTEPEQGVVTDNEDLMSLYRTICIPMAVEQAEKTVRDLCRIYHIPEIDIRQKSR